MIAAIDARTSTDAGNPAPRSASPSPSARALRSEASPAAWPPLSAPMIARYGRAQTGEADDGQREERRARRAQPTSSKG
jgi:hypothetical protein